MSAFERRKGRGPLTLRPNKPFLRNRQRANGFSGEERPLAVVEVPADRFAGKIVGF